MHEFESIAATPVPDFADEAASFSNARAFAYRLAIYLSMSLADDPAWLAFWFC